MEFHSIFPVIIALSENKNHDLIQNKLIKECKLIKNNFKKGGYNWGVSTFNTCGTYNLTKNKNFNNLHKWIFKEVKDYTYKIGYQNNKIKCTTSWFNIYNKYDYQERHEHSPNDISAIYYLQIPKYSGKIKFYSHEPNGIKYCYAEDNSLTWKSYWINPKPGMLLVFKSNLMHEVEQNKSNEEKISIALNFKIF
jgi:uncharacterized protein (TIGR02466 family)